MPVYNIPVGATTREVVVSDIDDVEVSVQLWYRPELDAWLADVYLGGDPHIVSQVLRPYQRMLPGIPEVQLVVLSTAGLLTDLDEAAFSSGWGLYAFTGDDR